MAHLFKDFFKGTVPKAEEITINLNLTIRIEADGSIRVIPTTNDSELKKEEQAKSEYEIPEFGDFSGKLIKFGKDI